MFTVRQPGQARTPENGTPASTPGRIGLLCAAILVAGCSPSVATRTPGTTSEPRLVLASWNVENLYDPVDDPANPEDNDFTAAGWQRWTERRYGVKLQHLASVINQMKPDVLGLAEVENVRVLQDLQDILRDKYNMSFPHRVHRDGGDRRGIDVALLSRLPIRSHAWLTPVPGQRDVIVAELDTGAGPILVLMNHWKSNVKTGQDNEAIRLAEAQAVRQEVNRWSRSEPGLGIVVLGDFNVDAEGSALVQGLRSTTNRASRSGSDWLFNLHGLLSPSERGTTYYRKDRTWNTFDAIHVNAALLDPAGGTPSPWQVNGFRVFRAPETMDADGGPRSFRLKTRSSTGRKYYDEGYSDHFPVTVTLSSR
jgi:endonuclease/exonuclease/phosphatase family metal-dependent hydrolase